QHQRGLILKRDGDVKVVKGIVNFHAVNDLIFDFWVIGQFRDICVKVDSVCTLLVSHADLLTGLVWLGLRPCLRTGVARLPYIPVRLWKTERPHYQEACQLDICTLVAPDGAHRLSASGSLSRGKVARTTVSECSYPVIRLLRNVQ